MIKPGGDLYKDKMWKCQCFLTKKKIKIMSLINKTCKVFINKRKEDVRQSAYTKFF